MGKDSNKDFIQTIGIITIIILIITIIALLILKYEVEGEKDMPFELSKIIVVSSAEGYQDQETENRWEVNVYQNNDIYIDIIKNNNNKDSEIIKDITINNITINKKPQSGEIVIYKPTNDGSRAFSYSDDDIIENEIVYVGSENADIKSLQIANQGGLILFRVSNNLNEKYISNEDEELKHDGTLIKKINKTNEEIKCEISFDITINLESEKSFKATVNLELPIGDILEKGTESLEKTDFSDVVFKRL